MNLKSQEQQDKEFEAREQFIEDLFNEQEQSYADDQVCIYE